MNKNLINYHLSLKNEYHCLLKEFNILFYGYGNKSALLCNLFPKALQFNLKFVSEDTIKEEISTKFLKGKTFKTLKELDIALFEKGKRVTCIFLNFDFSNSSFENLKSISIVGTCENIQIEWSTQDLIRFNFILRDLTTFEDYSDDIIDFKLEDDKVMNVKLIISNLSKKHKYIFKQLLTLGNCTADQLFEKVKEELFLVKLKGLLDLLKEFTDHNIIKIKQEKIAINLTVADRNALINTFE